MSILILLVSMVIILPPSGEGDEIEKQRSNKNESVKISSEPSEYITIGGVRYEIVYPWKGHRYGTKDDTQAMGLVMVPQKYAFEQGKIYATKAARDAFVQMVEAARESGVYLQIDSGYRSIRYQKKIFQRLFDEGKEFDEIIKNVAPPGYSEHMLGVAFDFVPSSWLFVKSPTRKWLEKNASRFCFEESYPEDSYKRGLRWEPWHWRYNGCRNGVLPEAAVKSTM